MWHESLRASLYSAFPSLTVDHVIPRGEDPLVFYNKDLHLSVCQGDDHDTFQPSDEFAFVILTLSRSAHARLVGFVLPRMIRNKGYGKLFLMKPAGVVKCIVYRGRGRLTFSLNVHESQLAPFVAQLTRLFR